MSGVVVFSNVTVIVGSIGSVFLCILACLPPKDCMSGAWGRAGFVVMCLLTKVIDGWYVPSGLYLWTNIPFRVREASLLIFLRLVRKIYLLQPMSNLGETITTHTNICLWTTQRAEPCLLSCLSLRPRAVCLHNCNVFLCKTIYRVLVYM